MILSTLHLLQTNPLDLFIHAIQFVAITLTMRLITLQSTIVIFLFNSASQAFSVNKQKSNQFLRSKRGLFESIYKTRKEIVSEECSTFKSGPCVVEEVHEAWEGASNFRGNENGKEHHVSEQFNDWKHPCNKFGCKKDNTIGKRERGFTSCFCMCQPQWAGKFCEVKNLEYVLPGGGDGSDINDTDDLDNPGVQDPSNRSRVNGGNDDDEEEEEDDDDDDDFQDMAESMKSCQFFWVIFRLF